LIVAVVQQRLQTIGVNFTEEQTRCVHDLMAETDPQVDADFVVIVWSCGVDIANLPSG